MASDSDGVAGRLLALGEALGLWRPGDQIAYARTNDHIVILWRLGRANDEE